MTNLEVTFRNGSRLTTWGAENANAIRGQRFTHVIQDETDEIHPDVETAVIEPTFSYVGLNFVWVKTGTPSRGRHGILYRDYQRGQQGTPGYVSMLVRSADSPQVKSDWLARIKQTTPPSIFAREYDCNFDAAEGVVYGDVFTRANIQEPPAGTVWSDVIIGIDHGWEHPGVFLLIGVRKSFAKSTAESELIKQYDFMHRMFSNAWRRIDAANHDDERRRILKILGDASLEEHAQWILMHRERSIDQREIVKLS
jgi:hypothetical protein